MKKNLLFILLSFCAFCVFTAIGGFLLIEDNNINKNQQQQIEDVSETYASDMSLYTTVVLRTLHSGESSWKEGFPSDVVSGNFHFSVTLTGTSYIGGTTTNIGNYSVWLGNGASTSSGVRTSQELDRIRDYRFWGGTFSITQTASVESFGLNSNWTYKTHYEFKEVESKYYNNSGNYYNLYSDHAYLWNNDSEYYLKVYFYVDLYPKTYTITLDKQSGSGGTSYLYENYSRGVYLNNYAITETNSWKDGCYISCPTRTGYDFQGYYTSTNGGGTQKIRSDGYILGYPSDYTSNTTLYAHWTPHVYSVTLNVNNTNYGCYTNWGDGDYRGTSFTASAPYKSLITISGRNIYDFSDGTDVNASANEGYYFSHFEVDGSEINGSYTMPANNVTITAVFYPITYTVTLTVNNANYGHYTNWSGGGERGTSFTALAEYRTNLSINGKNIWDFDDETDVNATAYTGYTFVNFTVGGSEISDGYQIPASNITITANFRPNIYKVVYNANGGDGSAPGPQNNIKYNEDLELLDNTFTRTGYTFQGWSTNSGNNNTVNYTAGQTVRNLTSTDGGEVTLYAVWQANTYNLSYELNGGSYGTTHPTSATYDSSFTLSNPSRTGYTFAGWSASNIDTSTAIHGATQWTNGNDKTIDIDLKNLNPTNGATVTLTAHWTPIKYNVNLYRNLTASDTTYETLSNVEYDSNIEIVSNFQNSGKILAGWSKTRSDTSPTYITGDTLPNLTTTDRATINLYAIWIDAYTETSHIEAPTGSGTTNSPYLVSTPGQLAWIASQVNFDGNNQINVKLTSNIILDSSINWNPIGTKQNPYKGIFDGNGYAISGVSTKTDYLNAQGLFGYVQGGIIENLFVSNAELIGKTVGGLIGRVKSDINNTTTISQVYINANCSADFECGGIIGYVEEGAKVSIDKCIVKAILQNGIKGPIIGWAGDFNSNISYSNVYAEAESLYYIHETLPSSCNNVILNINGTKTINGSFSSGWIISANGTPIPEGLTWLETYDKQQATLEYIQNWANS